MITGVLEGSHESQLTGWRGKTCVHAASVGLRFRKALGPRTHISRFSLFGAFAMRHSKIDSAAQCDIEVLNNRPKAGVSHCVFT